MFCVSRYERKERSAELSETPYAYLWTSGTNLVEVPKEDGTITYKREFWNNNVWPGNKMIKFE